MARLIDADDMTKDEVLNALGNISEYFENCAKATYGDVHERFKRWMNAADWAAVYLNDNAMGNGGREYHQHLNQ